MHKRTIRLTTITLALSSFLSGCGTVAHRNAIQAATTESANIIATRTADERNATAEKAQVVRDIDGVFLGAKTVAAAKEAELPAVFSQPFAYQFPDEPGLSKTANRLSKMLGFNVRVSPDAIVPMESFYKNMETSNSNQVAANGKVVVPPISGPIGNIAPSMNGSPTGTGGNVTLPEKKFIIDMVNPPASTLSEFLDKLCAKYSVGWDYKDGSIFISRFVTRTYQLANIIDTGTLKAGINKTSDTGTSTTSSDTSGTSSKASSTSELNSKVEATIDTEKGIKDAISGVLTPNYGKYSISSSGLITVTDTREVQDQVRQIVEAEERIVGRQIAVRLQVIQIEATQADDTSFDLSWLITNAARKWNVNFTTPTGLPGGSVGTGQIGVIRNGGASTTSAFLKALSEIGKVNIRKDRTYRMLNNRMLSVADTDNYIYPAKTTPATSTSSSGTVSTTVGVEPGQLTTGTFLNMRSSIQPNGSVIMYFNLDASLRGKSNVYSSNGTTLEYPPSTSNQYSIYSSAVSGQTAVIASVDDTEQRNTDRSFDSTLSPLLGGGISASTTRKAVLILLTPTIIEGVQ